MKRYSFEKLEAWQLSRQLVHEIYQITKSFPSSEKFGLTNQMRRSAISISSNIAEGSARMSHKDQMHFYVMAFGSLIELLNQVILSRDLGFITEAFETETRDKIDKVASKLAALKRSRGNERGA